jgi:translation initiation factor 3 subunit B
VGFRPIDLKEQFDVRLDEGLDTFVVVDGCPCVPEDSKPKLIKFLCKKLGDVGKVKPDSVYMPLDENTKQTAGYDAMALLFLRSG